MQNAFCFLLFSILYISFLQRPMHVSAPNLMKALKHHWTLERIRLSRHLASEAGVTGGRRALSIFCWPPHTWCTLATWLHTRHRRASADPCRHAGEREAQRSPQGQPQAALHMAAHPTPTASGPGPPNPVWGCVGCLWDGGVSPAKSQPPAARPLASLPPCDPVEGNAT